MKDWLRRHPIVTCVVFLALGALVAEGGLRWLLFGSTSIGADLRVAGKFADHHRTDDYWRLHYRWGAEPEPVPERFRDPELGWISSRIDPETFRICHEPSLGDRRRVLLYGSSHVACNTSHGECFESLVRASELSEEYLLSNYGVPGYGLDQTLLMMRRTLPLYADEDPIVVLGLQVDEDLERCTRSIMKWPKPRFELVRGDLRGPVGDVPGLEEALVEGFDTPSFLAAGVITGIRNLSPRLHRLLSGENRHRDEVEALTRALLEAVMSDLDGRGIESFVMLFQNVETAKVDGNRSWRDALAHRVLSDLEIPFVSGKRALRECAEWSRRPLGMFYGTEGELAGHPNREGNRALVLALLEGLEGRFEPWGEFAPVRGAQVVSKEVEGSSSRVWFEQGKDGSFRGPAEVRRVMVDLKPGESGAMSRAQFTWPLGGLAHGFRARLCRPRHGETESTVWIRVLEGGEAKIEFVLPPGQEFVDLRVDLRGRDSLDLEAASSEATRVYLARPAFQ